MASTFPTSLDNLVNPTVSDYLNSTTVPHATQHATLNDAVEALEAKVGVDGSAVTTSHDYLIAKQSIVPYADAAARTAALPSPTEGQVTYLNSTNLVEVWDGGQWVAQGGTSWAAYTPSWTNLTLGNGSQSFIYAVNSKVGYIAGRLVFGGTTSMASAPSFSLPSGWTPDTYNQSIQPCHLVDDSATAIISGQAWLTTSSVALYAEQVSGSNVIISPVTSTLPFTWTTSDEIRVAVTVALS